MNSRNRVAVNRADGAAWINLLAGLWLIASPWIYGFAPPAVPDAWNSIVVGILIAAVAGLRLGGAGGGLAWINVVLGGWMIASPFVYGYVANGARTANSIIVGVIVLVVALAGLPEATAGRAQASTWGGGWGAAAYPPIGMYPPYGMWGYGSYGQGLRGRGFRGRGPRGYQRSDVQIRDAVCDRMADHPDLDASDIEVGVAADGVVTLQGTVDSREAKRLAEDVAESVSGVRDVHNQLRVSRGAAVRETPRRAA